MTASVAVTIALFAAFGAGSVAFWSWFRLHPTPDPDPQPEPDPEPPPTDLATEPPALEPDAAATI